MPETNPGTTAPKAVKLQTAEQITAEIDGINAQFKAIALKQAELASQKSNAIKRRGQLEEQLRVLQANPPASPG